MGEIEQKPLPPEVVARVTEIVLQLSGDAAFRFTKEFLDFSISHIHYVLDDEYSDAYKALIATLPKPNLTP